MSEIDDNIGAPEDDLVELVEVGASVCRLRPIDDKKDTRTAAQKAAGVRKPGGITPRGAFLYPRPTKRQPNRVHLGVDLAGIGGTPVRAPCDGKIIAAWYDNTTKPFSDYGPGGIMIMEKQAPYFHILAHMDPATIVPKGQYPAWPQAPTSSPAWIDGPLVACGDPVGKTASPHNHLHWTIMDAMVWNANALAIDPMVWLKHGDPQKQVTYNPWWRKGIANPAKLFTSPSKTKATVAPIPAPAAAPSGDGLVFVVIALFLFLDDERKRKRKS